EPEPCGPAGRAGGVRRRPGGAAHPRSARRPALAPGDDRPRRHLGRRRRRRRRDGHRLVTTRCPASRRARRSGRPRRLPGAIRADPRRGSRLRRRRPGFRRPSAGPGRHRAGPGQHRRRGGATGRRRGRRSRRSGRPAAQRPRRRGHDCRRRRTRAGAAALHRGPH
ncbi:MAG: hypothetical protein AVDCRST_MAG10-284, partial [uncultured Acidimicrobiales bacterium]